MAAHHVACVIQLLRGHILVLFSPGDHGLALLLAALAGLVGEAPVDLQG